MNDTVNDIKSIISIRKQITEKYKIYEKYKRFVNKHYCIEKNDFKRAVDAVHYFGGGYPSQDSKGRMEALLDNFVGMFHVLHLVDRGEMVTDHLKKHGISLEFNFPKLFDEVPNNMMSELGLNTSDPLDALKELFNRSDDLQTSICNMADTIKNEYKPRVINDNDLETEEYNRLIKLSRKIDIGKAKDADDMSAQINSSVISMDDVHKKFKEER